MQTRVPIKAIDLQRIGVSKPWAHQLLAGGKKPSLELAVKIQTEFGIPVTAWPLPEKEAA